MEDKHEAGSKHHEVKIFIDREPYHSPSPTTGKDLYRLGEVEPHHELFREACGEHTEDLIPDDDAKVHLKADEHLYSQKDYDIVVNGTKKEVASSKLSFERLVALAFPNPPSGPNILFTITYRKGPRQNPEGELFKGQTVRLKNGMVFNVTATDKS
jgi:hypothetical protein